MLGYKGYTGATQSLGKFSTVSTSTKHNINTSSSTETELVAAYGIMPHAMWKSYFLDYQGYKVN